MTWLGGVSTNWATGANWNTGTPPGTSDDVVIDGGTFQPTLSLLGGAVTVQSLSIGANNAATLTVAHADADSRRFIVSGNVTVGPFGVVTHFDNTTAEIHRLNMAIGGNLSIAAGGAISAYARGFNSCAGPGKPLTPAIYGYGGGAGHGGEGGDGYRANDTGGTVYGSFFAPVNLGSGGSSLKGGGAVILTVGGSTLLNGQIDADAARTNAGTVAAGGGSGGSVWLVTASLEGTGVVSAVGSGGQHSRSGQGGGGRIAIELTGSASPGGVTLAAWGGAANTNKVGSAGTIWIKGTNHVYGDLIVKNQGYDVRYPSGARMLMTGDVFRFDLIVVTNLGILEVGPGAVLDLTNGAPIRGDAIANPAGGGSRIVVSEGTVLFPPTYTLTNQAVIAQRMTNPIVFDTSLTVAAGSMLTHEPFYAYDVQFEFSGTETSRPNLAVTGDFTLQPGAFLAAQGIGYRPSFGPAPGNGDTGYGGGAGHGGEGARGNSPSTNATTYGSVTMPETLGSGGPGPVSSPHLSLRRRRPPIERRGHLPPGRHRLRRQHANEWLLRSPSAARRSRRFGVDYRRRHRWNRSNHGQRRWRRTFLLGTGWRRPYFARGHQRIRFRIPFALRNRRNQ